MSRTENRALIAIPGFGYDRVATALFLAAAVPMGLVLGRRPCVYVSLKLFSPTTAAAFCGRVRGRPFVAMATTSGPASEACHLLDEPGLAPSRRVPATVFARRMAAKRRALQRAAFVVAQTTGAAGQLARFIPAARLAVLRNPVVPLDEPPALDGHRRAVFTGRVSRDKGVFDLLAAWSGIATAHPSARLTLVGAAGRHEAAETEVREALAAEPVLGSTVGLTGWVDDVGPYLRAADVFVLCSQDRQEGMSNSLLEACAYGRIVVISDIPPNRAVVGDDYPLLFAPGDPDALHSALRTAFEDEEVRQTARECVLRQVRRFAVDDVVGELEALLLSSLSVARPATYANA